MRLALDEPDNLLRHIYALEQKAELVGWLVGWVGMVGIFGDVFFRVGLCFFIKEGGKAVSLKGMEIFWGW